MSAPFADSLAIVLREIEQLDAGQFSILTGPKDASRDLYGFRKGAEGNGDARNKIACKVSRRGDEKTIFADVQQQGFLACVRRTNGQEKGGMRDDARIEAAFESGR